MARVNSQQWLDKWGRRLGAAGTDIQAGVQNVKTAPGQKAAAAKATYVNNVTAAADVWAKNVSKVGLGDWQSAMINKGIPRLQQGITQAQQTKAAKIQQTLASVDAAVGDIANMPRGTLEQNIARSVAFQRAMAARAPKRAK
jgi:hypothetical protein